MTWLARWHWWHLALLWVGVAVVVVLAFLFEVRRRGGSFEYVAPFVPRGRFWMIRSLWAAAPDFPYLAGAILVTPVVALLITALVLGSRLGLRGAAGT